MARNGYSPSMVGRRAIDDERLDDSSYPCVDRARPAFFVSCGPVAKGIGELRDQMGMHATLFRETGLDGTKGMEFYVRLRVGETSDLIMALTEAGQMDLVERVQAILFEIAMLVEFCGWMKAAESYQKGLEIYREVKRSRAEGGWEMTPNINFFTLWQRAAKSVDERAKVYGYLKSDDVVIDAVFFKEWVLMAEDSEEVSFIFDKMIQCDIDNVEVLKYFGATIRRYGNFEGRKRFHEETVMARGIPVQASYYNSWLGMAKGSDEFVHVLCEMARNGVEPDDATAGTICRLDFVNPKGIWRLKGRFANVIGRDFSVGTARKISELLCESLFS